MTLAERRLDTQPFVVVDVETTGLDPETERVVELCAVRVAVRESPRVLLDTLVRPERSVAATAIHGITEADVARAPRFAELADPVESLLAERVVAGHNVAFDLGFLRMEFARLGRDIDPPHVCTMRLPGLFDGPANRPLWWACQRSGVPFDGHAHSARGDAMATARLLQIQLEQAIASGVQTFGDLAARGRRVGRGDGFVRSFAGALIPAPPRIHGRDQVATHPRARGTAGIRAVAPHRRYLDAVVRAVADLVLTADERRQVRDARCALGVDPETARSVHRRVVGAARRRYAEDGRIDPVEAGHLARLEECIALLDLDLDAPETR